MSQDFKLNFDDSRESKHTGQDAEDGQGASDMYDTPGNVRNLCFAWPDGRMKFMNYAYLISADLSDDENALLLEFSNEKIELTGQNLKLLFNILTQHKVKTISTVQKRYSEIDDGRLYMVFTINIKSH